MKKTKNEIVARKPNKIIEARQGLTATQHKILFSVFAQFRNKIAQTEVRTAQDYKDMIQTVYTVRLGDIINNIDKQKLTKNADFVKELEKEVKKIPDSKHEVQTETGWKIYNLVDFVEFYRETFTIEVRIAASMTEEILRWYKSGYTQIPLDEIIPLRSKYAIRIFEILLRVMNIPGVIANGYTISYEELRKKLGIASNEYAEFKNFKTRILKQAQREIMEKTAMRFSYDLERSNERKVENIRFYDITHDVKEVQTEQLSMFDFEEIENNVEKKAQNNAEIALKTIHKIHYGDDEQNEDLDEARREIERDIVKSITPVKYPELEDPTLQFSHEQNEILKVYLKGFSKNSVRNILLYHTFAYIEYYYKWAKNKDNIENFPAYLFRILQNDPHGFYEKEEKKVEEERIRKEKARQRKEAERQQKEKERIEKEKEERETVRLANVFDCLSEEKQKHLIFEYKKINMFFPDISEEKEEKVLRLYKAMIADYYEKRNYHL